MKRIQLSLVLVPLVLLAACAYRGAVYSEYTQFALDVRATQESSSPVKVNLGYDRGVLAYVPKLDDRSHSRRGEAVSLISWNNVGSDWLPIDATKGVLSSQKVLRVDAGFISGIAAVVASAPSNANVQVVADTTGKETSFAVRTVGGPGERIGLALEAMVAKKIGMDEQMIAEIVTYVRLSDGKVDVARLGNLLNGVANLDGNEFKGRPISELENRLRVGWRDFVKQIHKNLTQGDQP